MSRSWKHAKSMHHAWLVYLQILKTSHDVDKNRSFACGSLFLPLVKQNSMALA